MSTTATVAIIVVVYLVALFGVCGYAQKKQKQLEAEGKQGSFTMGGKSLSLAMVVFLMAGNMIGGTNTTGEAQLAMTAGMSAMWYGFACAIGVIFLGLVGANRLRKYRYNTTSSMVGDCCGASSRYMMTIGQLIIIQGVCCLQYVAGGALLSSMFPGIISYNSGVIISAIAFLIICMVGGLLGASISNFINCVVIFFGILATMFLAVHNLGGWEELVNRANSFTDTTQAGGSWLSITGGLGISVILSYLVSEPGNRLTTQSNTQAVLAAKDSKTARRGVIIAALLTLPICVASAVFGIIAKIQFPDLENSSQAMASVIMSVNPIVAGIGMAGLWATEISTGSALLMASTQLITNDVLAPFKKTTRIDNKMDVVTSRIILIILTAVTLLVAFTIKSMVGTLITILCITPAFFWVVLGLLYFPKLLKRHTAVITISFAVAFFLLWLFIPGVKAAFPTPIYFQWPACTVIFWLCNLIEKKPIVKMPDLAEDTN